MSRLASFRQADLTRVLRAMAAAHVLVSRVEVEPSGKIVLFTLDGPPPRGNSCDDILEPGFMPSPTTRRKHG